MTNLGFREALIGTALALSCDSAEPEYRAPSPSEQRMCEQRAELSRDEITLVLLALGSFDEKLPNTAYENTRAECLEGLQTGLDQ